MQLPNSKTLASLFDGCLFVTLFRLVYNIYKICLAQMNRFTKVFDTTSS